MCLKRVFFFVNMYDYDKKGCKFFFENNVWIFFGKGKLG